MLIRFIVSNFMSFKEETEFNMLTGNFKIHKHHIHKEKGLDLLKMAAIYGANGAGKSNLKNALLALKQLVLEGVPEKEHKTFWNTFKLIPAMREEATNFEVEFKHETQCYHYGIRYQQGEIVEEFLFQINPSNANKDQLVFHRQLLDGQTKIDMPNSNSTEKLTFLIELLETKLLKKNQPLLTEVKLKDFDGFEPLKHAYEWFMQLIIISPETIFKGLIEPLRREPPFENFINKYLKLSDTGVVKLMTTKYPFQDFFKEADSAVKQRVLNEIQTNNAAMAIVKLHEGYSISIERDEEGQFWVYNIQMMHQNANQELVQFNLEEESDGTRRVLDILTAIYFSAKSSVVFIDEISRSLHASLTKQLISLVAANKQMRGQLIFTTHESNLLDLKIFRQDEVWFAEKNQFGESRFYSLSDFKPRYDKDIRRGYLNGRFGGIPFLNEMENLYWDEYEKEEQGI